jgi:hypothetical protein
LRLDSAICAIFRIKYAISGYAADAMLVKEGIDFRKIPIPHDLVRSPERPRRHIDGGTCDATPALKRQDQDAERLRQVAAEV